MGKRENIKTTIQDAVNYWSRRIDECDLSIDWSEGETHCWRCGCEKKVQRCHIIPDSLGGKDEAASVHFGQPYFNTATMAGIYRMMLKKLADTYGVCLDNTQ